MTATYFLNNLHDALDRFTGIPTEETQQALHNRIKQYREAVDGERLRTNVFINNWYNICDKDHKVNKEKLIEVLSRTGSFTRKTARTFFQQQLVADKLRYDGDTNTYMTYLDHIAQNQNYLGRWGHSKNKLKAKHSPPNEFISERDWGGSA